MIFKEEVRVVFFSVCIKVRANFLKLHIAFKPICLHMWWVSALCAQALRSVPGNGPPVQHQLDGGQELLGSWHL